jgi:hypothetical protein
MERLETDVKTSKQTDRKTERSQAELATIAIHRSVGCRIHASMKLGEQYKDILTELNSVLMYLQDELGLPVFTLLELIAEYGVDVSTSTLISRHPSTRFEEGVMLASGRLVFTARLTLADVIDYDILRLQSRDTHSETVTTHHEWKVDEPNESWGLCVDPSRADHVYLGVRNKIILVNIASAAAAAPIVREYVIGYDDTYNPTVRCVGLLITRDGAQMYFIIGSRMFAMDTAVGLVAEIRATSSKLSSSEYIHGIHWSSLVDDSKDSTIMINTSKELLKFNTRTDTVTCVRSGLYGSSFVTTPRGYIFDSGNLIFFISSAEISQQSGTFISGSGLGISQDGSVALDASYSNMQSFHLLSDEKSLLVVERYRIRKVPLSFDLFL